MPPRNDAWDTYTSLREATLWATKQSRKADCHDHYMVSLIDRLGYQELIRVSYILIKLYSFNYKTALLTTARSLSENKKYFKKNKGIDRTPYGLFCEFDH